MTHELKTWPEPFAAIIDGRKTFEVRKADRPFTVGDTLHLREWNPDGSGYTGRWTNVLVTYLVPGGAWGLPSDLCVMGFSRAATSVPREVEEARNAVRASLDVTSDGPATCPSPWCGKEDDHTGECDSALIDWWGERDAIRAALRLLGGADGKETP